MKRIAIIAAALALGAPIAAHADTRWPAVEDCRHFGGDIAVQNYFLQHPESQTIGQNGRAFVSLVEALEAERPDLSPPQILSLCGFKNTARIWSLARSQAATPQSSASRRSMLCYGASATETLCEDE